MFAWAVQEDFTLLNIGENITNVPALLCRQGRRLRDGYGPIEIRLPEEVCQDPTGPRGRTRSSGPLDLVQPGEVKRLGKVWNGVAMLAIVPVELGGVLEAEGIITEKTF